MIEAARPISLKKSNNWDMLATPLILKKTILIQTDTMKKPVLFNCMTTFLLILIDNGDIISIGFHCQTVG